MTPTELAKEVRITLLNPPNKGVVFKSFIGSIHEPTRFINFCIKNLKKEIGSEFYEEVITTCKERINQRINFELADAEDKVLQYQTRVKFLKEQKAKLENLK